MKPSPSNSRLWWLRKRVVLPLLLLLTFAVALAIAVARSDASTIVVYNLTGGPLPPLLVRACDQTHTFASLPDESSVRMRLRPGGQPGPVELELAQDPPWRWEGAFISPRGGYRVILRVWPAGQVEIHTQISVWQRLLRGAPDLNE